MPEDKLTKELCCVEGFQSFWAISRCGKAAHVTNAVPGAHGTTQDSTAQCAFKSVVASFGL